jgi:methionyl-tRNA synthetase
LDGIVADVRRFSAHEGQVSDIEIWRDEARTGIALELAAARLLAACATPVMPRFAGRLTEALGLAPVQAWPSTVALVPPGSRITLAQQTFFPAPATTAAKAVASAAAAGAVAVPSNEPDLDGAEPDLLGPLCDMVVGTLERPAGDSVADATLVALGASSLHAVALQYQILERTGVELTLDELLGERSVAELADLLRMRSRGDAVREVAPA